ncbi:hypothetical protein PQX77_014569 [Marasmius sp. AFHP31]|nr:hypothetical protein PQX77_014569 [Marasmius sp. AFHP31]
MLTMLKTVQAPVDPPQITIGFKCRLNWSDSVSSAVVNETFGAIAQSCTDGECNYTEIKNDKNSYRTVGISKPDTTADGLHKILINAIFAGIKSANGKGGQSLQGEEGSSESDGNVVLADHEVDKYWSITDGVALNDSANETLGDQEDVIAEGSAAWYHLK